MTRISQTMPSSGFVESVACFSLPQDYPEKSLFDQGYGKTCGIQLQCAGQLVGVKLEIDFRPVRHFHQQIGTDGALYVVNTNGIALPSCFHSPVMMPLPTVPL